MNRGLASEVHHKLSETRKSAEYPMEITLEESFNGITKTLPINYGINGVRLNLTVTIPRGIEDGTKILLNTGDILVPEDIYVVVKIQPHRYFIRDGQNLHSKISIDLVDSILGTEIEIPTITGNVLLNIPPGTQTGIVFRLSGKGMPILGNNNHRAGNLYLSISINYPKNLSTEEKDLLLLLKYMQNNRTG
jgi:DnaJ-class molecular chaperone